MASLSADGSGNLSQGGPRDASPLGQVAGSGRFNEEFDASRRGSSLVDGPSSNGAIQRSGSHMSQ